MSDGSSKKKFIQFGPPQWLGLLLVVIATAFIAQNRSDVTIALLWFTVSAPLWVVLALISLVAFAGGYLLAWGRGRRRRRRVRGSRTVP
jgi:uncharacterized integral membrane protein